MYTSHFERYANPTIATAEAYSSIIVIGRATLEDAPAQPAPGSMAYPEIVAGIDIDVVLKGTVSSRRLRALVRPFDDTGLGLKAGTDDSFEGLMFLRERVVDDASAPPQGGIEVTLELPFGFDPALRLKADSFAPLRDHLLALLGLRRDRLGLYLDALSSDDERLRDDAASDIEGVADIGLMLDVPQTHFLIERLESPVTSEGARIALLRTLERVPAAGDALRAALGRLLARDDVSDGFRAQAGHLLARAPRQSDRTVFNAFVGSQSVALQFTGVSGLAALAERSDGGAYADLLDAVAEHPNDATRLAASSIVQALRSASP